MFTERTSVGLDVHARSVVAHAMDVQTGEIFKARLCPDPGEVTAWIKALPGPAAQVPREDDDPKKGVVVADDDAASGTAAAPPDAPTAGTGTTQEGDAGSASGTKTAASGAANAEKSELK